MQNSIINSVSNKQYRMQILGTHVIKACADFNSLMFVKYFLILKKIMGKGIDINIMVSTPLIMCFSLTFLIIYPVNDGLVMAPDFTQTGYDCVNTESEK